MASCDGKTIESTENSKCEKPNNRVRIVDYSDTDSNSDCDEICDSSKIINNGKRKREPQRVINKTLRQSGKSYFNYKNVEVAARKIQPNPCLNKPCNNECNKFTEEERAKLFSTFWNLRSSLEKQKFISDCTVMSPIKRKRTSATISRRNCTYMYYFMKDDRQAQVCLQFFLKTLNITQNQVRNAVKNKQKPNDCTRLDQQPTNKSSLGRMVEFRNVIESIPAPSSQFCLSSTSKNYLPSEIKSIEYLYRMFIEEEKELPLGNNTYKK